MTALYELASKHLALGAKLSDLDKETIADTLDGEAGELDEKLVAYIMVARNLETVGDAKFAASNELSDQSTALYKRAKKLRDTVHATMLACSRNKIDCDPHLTLTIKAKRAAVLIVDAAQIPAEFMDAKPAPAPAPSKERLYKALASGQVIDGAMLSSETTRLEVK